MTMLSSLKAINEFRCPKPSRADELAMRLLNIPNLG
jgi:hypothetical protein